MRPSDVVDQVHRAFWSSDRGLAALLVLLGVTVFVAFPAFADRSLGTLARVSIDALFALILITGARAVGWGRTGVVWVGAAVTLVVAMRWMGQRGTASWNALLEAGLSTLMLALLTTMVLRQVFREGPVTRGRLFGSVAAYLLIGLVFAEAYSGLCALDPGAFSWSGVAGEGGLGSRLAYFSLITLTTTGYGDILPVAPAARSLATLEGMVGQLFPAILIARLVAAYVGDRDRRSGNADA